MRRTLFLSSCLAIALAAACQEQPTQPEPRSAAGIEDMSAVVSASSLSAVYGNLVAHVPEDRLVDALRDDWARRVINGDVYQCSASTPVFDRLNEIVNESVAVELPLLLDLLNLAAFDIPTLELLFIPEYTGPQEYGYDGDFTNVIERTDRSIRRFWDIFSDDIEVVPLKGSMILDVDRVTAVYEEVFALDPATSMLFATIVRDLVLASQTLDEGDHPLFSANAFAASFGAPLPDRIAMGDGILEAYADIGLGDVAARGIFAHEYSHHVQFEKDFFNEDPPSFDPGSIDQAERTRFTELMADAMAAYFLTHKRGAAMNWWRVEQFLQVFFSVGDCAFQDPNHHGTPEQRLRASRWAFELASDVQKQGQVLTADEFHDLFVAEYLDLIAPDLGEPAPDGNVDPGNSSGRGNGPQR